MERSKENSTMETRREKSSSGEIFSFPSTPNQDDESDFEFGCFTPDSPSQDPERNSSPADHLFLNGRLLPHQFPFQPATTMLMVAENSNSRGTSRTSSVSSKDSLMSSRSNSTNSRNSCSSGRTSSSSSSRENINILERNKLFYHSTSSSKATNMQIIYGSSQRWQYITPVLALKRDTSRRKNGGVVGKKEGLRSKEKGDDHQERRAKACTQGPWRRFFRSFLVACRECHAMESSSRGDDVIQDNMRL